MNFTCNRKGCMQSSEAKLNLETNEVICDECGQVIDNMTEFTKRTLKQAGQVLRVKSVQQAFQVFCPTCNKNVELILDEGKAYCKTCKSPLALSATFLRTYKEQQDKARKEEHAKSKKGE
jgi:RNase P subunit RPR2